MLTPHTLATIAADADADTDPAQYSAGIAVHLGDGLITCSPDGTLAVLGPVARCHPTPAQVRALLYGLRMLDATSDLDTQRDGDWRASLVDAEAWRGGR